VSQILVSWVKMSASAQPGNALGIGTGRSLVEPAAAETPDVARLASAAIVRGAGCRKTGTDSSSARIAAGHATAARQALSKCMVVHFEVVINSLSSPVAATA
jgi:hypothetical protein